MECEKSERMRRRRFGGPSTSTGFLQVANQSQPVFIYRKWRFSPMERDDLIMAEKKVAVVMGSDSDLGVVRAAIDTLKSFGIGVQARVISAHRTPQEAAAFASGARENGFSVIIAAAGKAAHLAGVLAAHTTLPVIGIPIKSSALDGLDALLATVQMPGGIPDRRRPERGNFGRADHRHHGCGDRLQAVRAP